MTQSISRRSPDVRRASVVTAIAFLATALSSGGAFAQTLGYADSQPNFLPWATDANAPVVQEPSVQDQPEANGSDAYVLPQRLQRQVVTYTTREAPGTIVIDTPNTVLYYVLGNNRAIRYGVGVGREGFTWSGVQNISRKAEWPDWHPPAAMIARQPYLPRFMAGGPGNPLGARAMYLGASDYRIHGTNDPTTIGKFVSSGCIRLTNADVEDLFGRVNVGTKVVVLQKGAAPRLEAAATRTVAPRAAAPAPALQHQAVNLQAGGLY